MYFQHQMHQKKDGRDSDKSIDIAPRIQNQLFFHKKDTRASTIPAVLYSTVQTVLLSARYSTCSAVHRDGKRYDRVNNVCVMF